MVLVSNVWAVGEFWQSCSSIPNWCCCCNLLLPVIPLYKYVTVPIFFIYLWLSQLETIVLYHFVHCWWFNEKWINPDLQLRRDDNFEDGKNSKEYWQKILGTICFYFCVNNKLVLIFGILIYRVVVPIQNGGVDEKNVIIMTQMRQINDLEKSLKVVEKRKQLVIGFTCVVIVLFVLLLCVIF